MGLSSMTGFASRPGGDDVLGWQWEARSVNARGLDVRVRLPDGLDTLETKVRRAVQDRFSRGAFQIALRLSVPDTGAALEIDQAALGRVLEAGSAVARAAQDAGLPVAPITAGEILSLRGVVADAPRAADKAAEAAEHIAAEIPSLLKALASSRREEGARLATVLDAQVALVDGLVARAAASAEARAARQGDVLRARVAALMGAQTEIDAARLTQELALIAVKSDITEELDRLRAHVAAAQDLLASDAPVGRRFDFLIQEFNREANTLCSKSQDAELTQIGLDLKVVIDQMREQVQNVE